MTTKHPKKLLGLRMYIEIILYIEVTWGKPFYHKSRLFCFRLYRGTQLKFVNVYLHSL